MKFLICGCNGMAGHTIGLYLKERGHEVFGFDKVKSQLIDSIAGDACDQNFVKKIIEDGSYDVIINCIGILNQAAEDNKTLSIYLNSFFPHFLAEITKHSKTRIIHMSTDCVFSGKKGEYTEYDFKDGETFYDRTKALGELDDHKNITLRNSIVGPDMNENGIGLLNWFMKQKRINGYTQTLWTGQTTLQLAKTMEAIATGNYYGLFNMVPDKSISKCDLLKLFNKYLRNNAVEINEIEGPKIDKSLKRTNYSFNYIIPDYENMIKEMAEWIYKHKDLYSHYFGE